MRMIQPWCWRQLPTLPILIMLGPMLMEKTSRSPSFLLSASKASNSSPASCWSPSCTCLRFPPCTAISSSSVLVLSCSKLLACLSISSPENKFHSLVSIRSTVKQHQQCLRHYFCYCSPINGLLIQNWSQFVFQKYQIHVSIRHQRYNSQKTDDVLSQGQSRKGKRDPQKFFSWLGWLSLELYY